MSGPVELRVADGIAALRFNRPERMNVLSVDMAEAFAAAVDEVLAQPSVRVLVLSGEGRNFMAGGDLQGFRTTADRPGFIRATIDPLHGALKALARSDIVTLAAVHGRIAGAGVSLAAMADLVIAAEGTSFTMAYTRIAGSPDCGASWALPRVVGLKRAMEMMLLNAPLEAEDALRAGLINRIVPAAGLMEAAMEMARQLAAGPAAAQGSAKRLLLQAGETTLEDQLDAERAAFVRLAGLEDFHEGVSAFLERRAPVFGNGKGR